MIEFTLNDLPINFTLNAETVHTPSENARLLEDGFYRLLEDDAFRILELTPPTDPD